MFSRSKEFKITKLKEYDGDNSLEEMFLKGLFTQGSYLSSLLDSESEIPRYVYNEVTASDLYDSFNVTMNKILSNINSKNNKSKIFEKKILPKTLVILLMLISFITIIVVPTLQYAGFGDVGITLLICLFYVPFFAIGIFAEMPLGVRIFWLGFTFIHSLAFFSTLSIAEAILDLGLPRYKCSRGFSLILLQ